MVENQKTQKQATAVAVGLNTMVIPPGTQIYFVGAVENKHIIRAGMIEKNLDLIWADGMIGVMPVFTDKIKAIKYAGDKFEVFTVEVKAV